RRRLRRGIELANDAHRAAGPAGGQRRALEQEHVPDAPTGQVERDRRSRHTTPDDDNVGGAVHGAAMAPKKTVAWRGVTGHMTRSGSGHDWRKCHRANRIAGPQPSLTRWSSGPTTVSSTRLSCCPRPCD